MCGKKLTTRTNERGFHIARTCANVRIADTGVEPVISCLGGKRGYPFHSSAIAVCRICTHKPKLKAYYWLQSVPKSIDTQHTLDLGLEPKRRSTRLLSVFKTDALPIRLNQACTTGDANLPVALSTLIWLLHSQTACTVILQSAYAKGMTGIEPVTSVHS